MQEIRTYMRAEFVGWYSSKEFSDLAKGQNRILYFSPTMNFLFVVVIRNNLHKVADCGRKIIRYAKIFVPNNGNFLYYVQVHTEYV